MDRLFCRIRESVAVYNLGRDERDTVGEVASLFELSQEVIPLFAKREREFFGIANPFEKLRVKGDGCEHRSDGDRARKRPPPRFIDTDHIAVRRGNLLAVLHECTFIVPKRPIRAVRYTHAMASRFIHLHTHSHYSLLQALPKTDELVEAAKRDGMEAVALTDAGNLYGAIDFYKAAKAAGIKPIIGLDAYLALRTRHDKEARIDNRRYRLVLLAKNLTGYQNLLELVTLSFLEGFYYKPRIDRELLEKYGDGLIAILPSFSGEVAEALKGRDAAKAKEALLWYLKVFGTGNVYLEITHHPEMEGHEALQRQIGKLSTETGVPLVAAHDVYYLDPADRLARETMVRIQNEVGERGGFTDNDADFSFITQEKALELFKDTPEALENAVKIANECNVELTLGKWVFPAYPKDKGPYEKQLSDLVQEGIEKRRYPRSKELDERIAYELSIINAKGFTPYFLIVADLLRFARENGILTTTRGSAAGSMVSYLTGVTNIDPIAYRLPFQRFLNPERPKAPDIDMDYADDRRDEVIEYARKKYGEDHVAQIGTFGAMLARGVVRDVARALGHPYGLGDRIAKLIPMGSQGFPMTIDRAFEMSPELSGMYKKEPEVREIIDLSKKIEGCVRHISVHAAGVVISPGPLINYTPLQLDPKGGKLITQYDMYSITDEYGGVGLLKFDFLGIKNLAILADSVKRAKVHSGVSIDIETVPVDDKKTFEMLARGETMGLFQLNGDGMTRYLKELKPSTIFDINAMVALYRPGPMESIPQYIERKHNPHLVTYLDPRMKEILNQSYGVVTYQDDVLLIAVNIAGYSWLEADALRKAMGKKIPAEMEAQREKLIEGAVKNGMTKEKAERLWKLIEPFAAYGFNKAHAASYGRVAYQTAYMKANFPVEYMAALLTADAGNVDKVAEAIAECKRMGIAVLPPDVNESESDFTVVKGGSGKDEIRFGLSSIKNFGEGVGESIIAERKKNGRFTSLANFLERVTDKNLNRKALEALIKCGALDAFEERGVMLTNIETLLTFHRESTVGSAAQDSLFGAMSSFAALRLAPAKAATNEERLAWEKELLGLYISGHPLDKFKEKLQKRGTDIATMKSKTKEGMVTVIAGLIEEVRPILTKNGEQMAFIRIVDFSDKIETVLFPRVMNEYRALITPENCIAIKGRLSGRNGELSLIAEAVKAL